jgi:hypothetical protein
LTTGSVWSTAQKRETHNSQTNLSLSSLAI